jgi:hypothetical protein
LQNLKVIPLPRDQYGQFYDGDSYIIYAASEYGKPATADMKVNNLFKIYDRTALKLFQNFKSHKSRFKKTKLF